MSEMAKGICLEDGNPPALLWHYTSGSGLLGILDNGCIWASSINFLNDASENRRASELLSQSIKAVKEQEFKTVIERLSANDKRVTTIKEDVYEQQMRDIIGSDVWGQVELSTFVASFSSRRDSLSQWRAYSGSGASYAIGFSFDDLMKLQSDPPDKLPRGSIRKRFGKVDYYDKNVHDKTFASIADEIITNTLIAGTNYGPRYVKSSINWLSPFFKDGAFAEECEWRLVCRGDLMYDGVRFRPGRSHLIPYLAIPFAAGSSPIKEIMVGPGPNPGLDVLAFEMKMAAQQGGFEVSESAIPFRNW